MNEKFVNDDMLSDQNVTSLKINLALNNISRYKQQLLFY